jgi:predicted HTH transcriptional regulator
VEFKSTLRVDLKTGSPDTRIEFAALKTIVGFLNGQGGTLLIGVDDDKNVLGLALDKFENDDKLQLHLVNLINGRIGDVFRPYIRPYIAVSQGASVLVVRCEPGPCAAFLKDGNQQRFFVRGGNATAELAGTALIEYAKQRFG